MHSFANSIIEIAHDFKIPGFDFELWKLLEMKNNIKITSTGPSRKVMDLVDIPTNQELPDLDINTLIEKNWFWSNQSVEI